MTEARAGLDTAKVMDVFARESAYLDALQQREVAAVIARDEAQRDAQLAQFLEGNEGKDGASLFAQDIETRLDFYYGALPAGATSVDRDPEKPLWRRMDLIGIDASLNAQLQEGYERAVRNYAAVKGKRPTDCGTVLLKPAVGSDSQAAQDAYSELTTRCSQIAGERALAQTQAPQAAANGGATSTGGKPGTGQVTANTGLYTPYAIAFNYREATQAVAAIQQKIAADRSTADALDKSLSAKALGNSAAPGTTDSGDLGTLSGEIHSALSEGETYLNNPYAKKVVSAKIGKCIEAVVDATATPKGTGASEPASTGAAVPNAVPSSAAAGRSTSAAGSGAATGSCGDSSIKVALALFQATAGVGDAFSTPPRIPHPNVLAVARAQMSYSQEVANDEIADLNTQANAASAQLEAVSTELYMLSRAKTELRAANMKLVAGQGMTDFLANPKTSHEAYRHATAALFYYTSAWNRGQILSDKILVESDIAERRSVVRQSSRAAQAWVGTIGPALDTLVQYGAGGIDPKTVAQLIGSVGLVGTAVGVNR